MAIFLSCALVSLIFCTVCAEHYEVQVAFPSMMISREEIERECPYSAGFPLYSIQFNVGYAYQDNTTCNVRNLANRNDPFQSRIVEYRPGLSEFVNSSNNFSREMENCMNESNCHRKNLENWKRGARDFLKSCSTCVIQRDGSCLEEILVRHYTRQRFLLPIIETMFVHALINCSIQPDYKLTELPLEYDRLNQPFITNSSNNKFDCPADQRVKILAVVQQAEGVRKHLETDESSVPSLIEEVSHFAEAGNSAAWPLPVESLTVVGGYWWGDGPFSSRNRSPPISLLVTYDCLEVPTTSITPPFASEASSVEDSSEKIDTEKSPAALTQLERQQNVRSEENEHTTDWMVVGLASGGVALLLVVIVLVIVITVRRHHHHGAMSVIA